MKQGCARCMPEYGLKIVEPVHYGHWCAREEFLSCQDIILATKA